MTIFSGSGVALITPMNKNGEINFDTLKELVEWHIESKTDALIICGTTGECSTLSNDERIKIMKKVIRQVRGRIPVIVGTGSNDTKQAIYLSKQAENLGADALLVVTPYYNKSTKRNLVLHYSAICKCISLPVILYSVVSRTGLNLTMDIVKELKKIPNIKGIKEASGNISQIANIATLVSNDFALYSGNDDQVLPILSLGGSGTISTIGNIAPFQTSKMIHQFFSGDLKSARKEQIAQLPLINAIFSETNPVPIKAAMFLLGKCEMNYRLPLGKPEKETILLLKKEMCNYGIL